MPESLNQTIAGRYPFAMRYRQVNEYTKNSYDTTENSSIAWSETRSGVQNPRWREQVKALQNASTDYTRDGKVNITPGRFMMDIYDPNYYGYAAPDSYWERLEGTYGSLPGYPEYSTKAYNIALADFLKNINEALSPFKGMTFLGELKETLKMLRRPASSLRDGFSAYLKRTRRLRRGRHPNTRELRKALSGMWLEYVFGWKPLLGDIEAAAEAYKKLADRVKTSFCIGEAFETISSSVAERQQTHSNHLKWTEISVDKKTDKLKFKGVVKHAFDGIQQDTASRIADLSGFRLEEFVPTVWELIPYSWIVDYFTNIGDILNGMHAVNADMAWVSLSRWATRTKKTSRKADPSWAIQLLGKECRVLYSDRPFEGSRVRYTRTSPTLAVPNLQLTFASSWQWVNLLALAGSKIR